MSLSFSLQLILCKHLIEKLYEVEGESKVSKAQYPTKEGLWSKGEREEESYRKVRLGMPYPEAFRFSFQLPLSNAQ